MAYEYGIKDLWIVNVGDIRPQELPSVLLHGTCL